MLNDSLIFIFQIVYLKVNIFDVNCMSIINFIYKHKGTYHVFDRSVY